MANKTDIFDDNYIRQITDKWLTNIVIPQVYDDSLSYYEEMNKLIGCLNEVANVIDGYSERLLQEVNERIKADASLQANIDAEANARERHDNIIKNNLAGSIRWNWNITGDNADTLSSISITNALNEQ
jgi:hypothetical protein